MVRKNIKVIIAFIIGVILTSSVSVYALYHIHAKDVSFAPENEEFSVNDVNSALNELYKIKNQKLILLNRQNEAGHAGQNVSSGQKEYVAEVDSELLIIFTMNYSHSFSNLSHTITSTNSDFTYEEFNYAYSDTWSSGYSSTSISYAIKTNKVKKGDKITLKYNVTPIVTLKGANNITSSLLVFAV